jgi:superoxide reductase
MTKRFQVYKCELCDNIVIVLHEGAGNLVCCGAAMKLMAENSTDAAREKHVPVIEKTSRGCKVKVGSVPHPMEEKHYIEWIEMKAGEIVFRKFFKPGEAPEAEFITDTKPEYARAYCNLHGLWKS